MSVKHPVIKPEEKKIILSMASYWEEVNRREVRTPLREELASVVDMLGIRLLWIVKDYAERN